MSNPTDTHKKQLLGDALVRTPGTFETTLGCYHCSIQNAREGGSLCAWIKRETGEELIE